MKRTFINRRLIVFCNDIVLSASAWMAACFFHFKMNPFLFISLFSLPFILLIQAWWFYFCGLYRGIWRFASIPDLIRILQAVILGMVSISLMLNVEEVPLTFFELPIIYGILLILFLSAPRILYRWSKDYKFSYLGYDRVLIIGAGSAAESIVRDLRRLRLQGYRPVAFVDDDPKKIGQEIHGIRVRTSCKFIPQSVKELDIQLCIIAMPSATAVQMRRIVSLCEKAKVKFCTLPSLREIAEGRVSINVLRDVSLQDLLGREEIDLKTENISAFIANKIIAVTGGGGSIGSELCIQIAALNPKQLVVIENCEFNLYSIGMKLQQKYPDLNMVPLLLSVTDRVGIEQLFTTYRPEIIFHAAAYKHVPLLESQLRVAVFNNIIGTRIIAEASVKYGCSSFTLISTDKAVNPKNVMGATKRAAEIICQSYSNQNQTRFIIVRFGNVLESSGSVIHLFRKQLETGGPLTITHPDISRFFMTIPEASQLIIQASDMGKGGDVFVLDMGEPIKIKYLAEKLVAFSGKKLGKDIEITYTGLRAGEKLHEELFYQEEKLNLTNHPKIYQAQSSKRSWLLLVKLLDEMEDACDDYDLELIQKLLQHLVPEFEMNLEECQPAHALQLTFSHSF